jgi:iron complex transport system ATP-binding protein
VRLDDRPVTELSALERARRVAFLPQRIRPLYDMPVRGIVELARHPHQRGWVGVLSAEDRRRVEEAMHSCAVHDLRERSFATLSGGERQRVLLAAALAQSSKALVLDEPTTALDPHHQVETFQHLRDVTEAGAAVLVATHDLNLAATFADRLLLLDGGRVAIEGDPAAVLSAETLERVFGPGLRVGAHADGAPWVLPHAARRRP